MSYIYSSMKLKDLYLEIDSNIELINILDFNILDRLTKYQVTKLFYSYPDTLLNHQLFYKTSMQSRYRIISLDINRIQLFQKHAVWPIWKWRYWDWYHIFYEIFSRGDFIKMNEFKEEYRPYKFRSNSVKFMNAVCFPYESDWNFKGIDLYKIANYDIEYMEYISKTKWYWKISGYHWSKLIEKWGMDGYIMEYINYEYLIKYLEKEI